MVEFSPCREEGLGASVLWCGLEGGIAGWGVPVCLPRDSVLMVDCLLVLEVGEGVSVELERAGLVRAGCCEAAFCALACLLACASRRRGGEALDATIAFVGSRT